MNFGENAAAWEELFSDYRMRLVCINEMEEFSQFHSTLQKVFQVLACREDKEKLSKLMEEDASYRKVDEETAEVIGTMVGVELEVAKNNKEDTYDMCKAIRDLIEDGRNEGIQEDQLRIVKNMCKKGLDMERIADLTGIPEQAVRNYAAEKATVQVVDERPFYN